MLGLICSVMITELSQYKQPHAALLASGTYLLESRSNAHASSYPIHSLCFPLLFPFISAAWALRMHAASLSAIRLT